MKETVMCCTGERTCTATKSELRALVAQLPANQQTPMLLGLDGDCDFSCKLTSFLPHMCGRDELLALIDREDAENLPAVYGLPDFLVLCRRHAVWMPPLLRNADM